MQPPAFLWPNHGDENQLAENEIVFIALRPILEDILPHFVRNQYPGLSVLALFLDVGEGIILAVVFLDSIGEKGSGLLQPVVVTSPVQVLFLNEIVHEVDGHHPREAGNGNLAEVLGQPFLEHFDKGAVIYDGVRAYIALFVFQVFVKYCADRCQFPRIAGLSLEGIPARGQLTVKPYDYIGAISLEVGDPRILLTDTVHLDHAPFHGVQSRIEHAVFDGPAMRRVFQRCRQVCDER